jgi:hypothetical protein
MGGNMIAYFYRLSFQPLPLYDAFLRQDGIIIQHKAENAVSTVLPPEKALTSSASLSKGIE